METRERECAGKREGKEEGIDKAWLSKERRRLDRLQYKPLCRSFRASKRKSGPVGVVDTGIQPTIGQAGLPKRRSLPRVASLDPRQSFPSVVLIILDVLGLCTKPLQQLIIK